MAVDQTPNGPDPSFLVKPNDRQIGGEHYKGADYQHWDWANDVRISYIAGCATKYVFRHRKKHGLQDLEKALHYLDKAAECQVPPCSAAKRHEKLFRLAIENDSSLHDIAAIWFLMEGQWEEARAAVVRLIEAYAVV